MTSLRIRRANVSQIAVLNERALGATRGPKMMHPEVI